MTPYQTVYDACLSKINEDEWDDMVYQNEYLEDWRSLLESALPYFKFPRISLSRDELGFFEDLGEQEIQIIGNLMKQEWLDRTISSWENVKMMYDERDFSPANMLDKLTKFLSQTEKKNIRLQKLYSRSRIDDKGYRKPFQFSKLAGGSKNE